MSLVKLPTKCLSFRWEVKPFLQRRAIAIDVILLRVWQLLLYQVARWHNLLGIVITRRWAFKVTSNCYSLLVPIKGISRNEWLGGVTSFSDADCTIIRCCTRCSWLVRLLSILVVFVRDDIKVCLIFFSMRSVVGQLSAAHRSMWFTCNSLRHSGWVLLLRFVARGKEGWIPILVTLPFKIVPCHQRLLNTTLIAPLSSGVKNCFCLHLVVWLL